MTPVTGNVAVPLYPGEHRRIRLQWSIDEAERSRDLSGTNCGLEDFRIVVSVKVRGKVSTAALVPFSSGLACLNSQGSSTSASSAISSVLRILTVISPKTAVVGSDEAPDAKGKDDISTSAVQVISVDLSLRSLASDGGCEDCQVALEWVSPADLALFEAGVGGGGGGVDKEGQGVYYHR